MTSAIFNREEFEEDKSIDPNELDVEVTRQCDVFFKWAERHISATMLVEKKEYEFAVLEARLELECRDDPEKFGINNLTEAAVKAAIKASPRYTKAKEEILLLRTEGMLLAKAVAAIEMKKRMLDNLITLHGQEYFAGPAVPRNLPSAWLSYQNRRGVIANDRQRQFVRKRATQEEAE